MNNGYMFKFISFGWNRLVLMIFGDVLHLMVGGPHLHQDLIGPVCKMCSCIAMIIVSMCMLEFFIVSYH